MTLRRRTESFVARLLGRTRVSDPDPLVMRVATSPHGARFVHAEMPGEFEVSIQIGWPTDWAYTGAPSAVPLIGCRLLVAGGAGERTPAATERGFEALGAEGGLYPLPDHVRGFLHARIDSLDAALELGADLLARPGLDEQWFDRIRDDVGIEIEQRAHEPLARADTVRLALQLGDTALLHTLCPGLRSDEPSSTLADVRRWHRDTLHRGHSVNVVAGGLDAAAAGRALDRLLSRFPEAVRPLSAPLIVTSHAPRTVLLHTPGGAGLVSLSGPLPPHAGNLEAEDLVAVKILGEGPGSRLHEALRLRLRASYAPQAAIVTRTLGLRELVMHAELAPESLGAAREVLRAAYSRFVAEGPSEAEIRSVVEPYRDAVIQALRAPRMVTHVVLGAELDGESVDGIDSMLADLDGISASGLRQGIQKRWPAADSLVEVLLSPDARAAPEALVIDDEREAVALGPIAAGLRS